MGYKPSVFEIQGIATIIRQVVTFIENLIALGVPIDQVIQQLRTLADSGLMEASAVDLSASKKAIVDDIDLGFDNCGESTEDDDFEDPIADEEDEEDDDGQFADYLRQLHALEQDPPGLFDPEGKFHWESSEN